MKVQDLLGVVVKHRHFLLMTGIILMLGLIFSNSLRNVAVSENTERHPSPSAPLLPQEGSLYKIFLGRFEEAEAVFAVEGALRILGQPVGLVLLEDGYHLFTEIASDYPLLETVAQLLAQEGIDFEIRQILPAVAPDDAWSYFYKAVNGTLFQIEESFMDLFGTNEMAIWGYFDKLSGGGRGLTSAGRQQMLLEIFEWLTMKQGDRIGNSNDEGFTG